MVIKSIALCIALATSLASRAFNPEVDLRVNQGHTSHMFGIPMHSNVGTTFKLNQALKHRSAQELIGYALFATGGLSFVHSFRNAQLARDRRILLRGVGLTGIALGLYMAAQAPYDTGN